MSVGLSLIYATTGLSNFAHAETVTMGAVITWTVNDKLSIFEATTGFQAFLQLGFATLFGIAATMFFSAVLETQVWRPDAPPAHRPHVDDDRVDRHRHLRPLLHPVPLRRAAEVVPAVLEPAQHQLGSPVTPRDLIAATISLACLGGVAYMLMRTRTGKAIRAVSDNPDLASSTGINTDRIILIVWVLGGGLAGLGGVLLGLDEQVQWDMGSRLLLLMFAAITLGGLGSAVRRAGRLARGRPVRRAVGVGVHRLTDLKNVGALLALIVILLVRPQGILGRKERIG